MAPLWCKIPETEVGTAADPTPKDLWTIETMRIATIRKKWTLKNWCWHSSTSRLCLLSACLTHVWLGSLHMFKLDIKCLRLPPLSLSSRGIIRSDCYSLWSFCSTACFDFESCLTLSLRILSVCVCVIHGLRLEWSHLPSTHFNQQPCGTSDFLSFFSFFLGPHLKICYLKRSQERMQNNRDFIYPPKATSIGYCQSLSRFYVKLPIHAVSIDQTTKCLFIFFSIQLVFLWLSDSSFISVSECPVLNG